MDAQAPRVNGSMAAPVSQVILDSWARARAAGLDRDAAPSADRRVPADDLARRLAASRDLVALAEPHLRWISTFFARLQHVACIADRDGVVLLVAGAADRLDVFGLHAGRDFSEAAVGTNGAGTAIVAGRPVAVVGPDHFLRAFHGVTCTAAPIHGPDGTVAGVIDVVSSAEDGHVERLALVAHTAAMIGRELARRAARDDAARVIALERLRDHLSLASALAQAIEVPDIARRIVDHTLDALGAGAVWLFRSEPATGDLVCIETAGYEPRIVESYRRVPRDAPLPIAEAARSGEAVYVGSPDEWARRYPLVDAAHLSPFQARASVPLIARGRVLGALGLSYAGPHAFGDDERAFIEAIASHCAQALDRAHLLEAERRARRAREDLLAIVSHDLRSPLSVTLMKAHMLAQHLPPGDAGADARRHLDDIRRASERMRDLVEDLLDFARIESGHHLAVDLQPEPIDPVLTQAAEAVQPLAAAKGITLTTELPGEETHVLCDRRRILQVLANLLGNAVKFTPKGGSITLRAHAGRGDVRVEVCDTGPGIPAEQLPHLFDRYWQASAGDGRGVGLGLFIAKALVDEHAGEIGVTSTPGAGSTFFFTLARNS